MMKRNQQSLILMTGLLLVAMLLAACGGAPATQAPAQPAQPAAQPTQAPAAVEPTTALAAQPT
jgi:hypothetical protein